MADPDHATPTVGSPAIEAPAVAPPPPSLPVYQPMAGRINESQLLSARQEYRRLAAEGKEDFPILVATRVPAQSWQDSSFDVRGNGCRVDLIFSADMAFVDIELVDAIEGGPHAGAVKAVNCQLDVYSQWQVGEELLSGVGAIPFTDGNGAVVEKLPDGGLVTNPHLPHSPSTPRLIVEVSVNHYTLPKAQRAYRAYFDGMPTVRAVLLLKFYGLRLDDTAAAAAVLYRRNNQGAVFVADSVSFGSAGLEAISEAALDKVDAMQGYQDLSGGPNGNFDALAQIVVPAIDLYHDTLLVDQDGALLVPRPDLVINQPSRHISQVLLSHLDRHPVGV